MSGDNITDIAPTALRNTAARVPCTTAEHLIEIYLVIVKVLGNLLQKSIKAVNKKNPVNNLKKKISNIFLKWMTKEIFIYHCKLL